MISELVSRDSKGKIRVFKLTAEANNEIGHIYRQTGILGGKMTDQPIVEITEGKQKRDIQAQTHLQFMSLRKKQMDKGYKELENPLDSYTIAQIEEVVGENKTNQSGIIKPMLAKQADKVTNRKIFDKVWYASRKLDGLRCLMFAAVDGTDIHTASRGGTNYDIAISHIIHHDITKKIFEAYPTIILDGEIYRHGDKANLQKISGAGRKLDTNTPWLEYFVYDIYDTAHPELTFEDRIQIIAEIAAKFDLDFNPYHEENKLLYPDGYVAKPIQICPHVKVSGWDNMMKLHNEYVMDGYEGVVIRDPKKPYKPAGRTNDMIKIKEYKSSEFKCTGYKLGMRGSEDMTFECETKDGKKFFAMPVGDRDVKAEYVANFETTYKNHMLECTYFNLSDDGVPTQPKGRVFRFDLEN